MSPHQVEPMLFNQTISHNLAETQPGCLVATACKQRNLFPRGDALLMEGSLTSRIFLGFSCVTPYLKRRTEMAPRPFSLGGEEEAVQPIGTASLEKAQDVGPRHGAGTERLNKATYGIKEKRRIQPQVLRNSLGTKKGADRTFDSFQFIFIANE